MPIKSRISQPAISASYLVWQIQDIGLRKSCLEVGRPMTGHLNPPKAPYPPAVYTSPITKGPRTASKLVPGKPNLVATPNAKVFQKKILLSLGKKITYNSNHAKCCVRMK